MDRKIVINCIGDSVTEGMTTMCTYQRKDTELLLNWFMKECEFFPILNKKHPEHFVPDV